MDSNPLVSVIMPVYNGMPYLPLAVESILNQSYRDFEFIIVNDCSIDDSLEYLKSITDERLILVKLSENKGITGALREGMNCVRGKYITRLDADDIALPNRLTTQVDFMENHPDIGICGSSYYIINEKGDKIGERLQELDDSEIQWRILFKNPFVHSTVTLRHRILLENDLNYSNLENIEDYVLWAELMKHTKAHILPFPLISYRTHTFSITQVSKVKQIGFRESFSFLLLSNALKKSDAEDLKIFRDWILGKYTIQYFELVKVLRMYSDICMNIALKITDPQVRNQFKNNRAYFLKRRKLYLFYKLVNLIKF